MKKVAPLVAVAVLALSGCWSRQQVIRPAPASVRLSSFAVDDVADTTHAVPIDVMAGMEPYLRQVLTEAGSYAATPDSGTVHVNIQVVDFHMRPTWARLLFGAWSGRDRMSSKVLLTDASGTNIGEEVISNYNQTAGGGAEFMVPENARRIAKALAGDKVKK